MMKNQSLYELRNNFLKEWPLERVRKMTIEEYTNLNRKDSFCYWIEKVTEKIGSIWGGSAFKFGIYKRKNTQKEYKKNTISDGEYAWLDKYGQGRDEAFNKVKNIIVDIIEKSQAGDFKAIESIDFGNATKWKIAHLYSDNKILNVFNEEKLKTIAQRLSISSEKGISFYELQNRVLSKKYSGEDYFDFARRIWNLIEMDKLKNYIDLLQHKHQIILQGPPGTGKTREAKRIARELLGLGENDSLEGCEQFKLIQFHPSYSYEDFVRGIVAKNTEGNIFYVTENKVLAEFAKKALEAPFVEPIKWEDFRDFLEEKKNKEGEVFFDKKKELKYVSIENNELKYLSKNENAGPSWNEMLGDVEFVPDWNSKRAGISIRNFSKENLDDNFVTFRKNQKMDGYWNTIVDYFIDWAKKFKKKPYVLIIDEINRANLSAVFGELIYALEYRGEAVQSMYAIDDDNTLVLPPNLYIIGTMNTADRSVGHIDYAIRRRFAFVNILPEDLREDKGDQFASALFEQVSELFDENLSPEFRKEDVQLGHSYFITEHTPINIRWEYEIKPILLEYVKDGILIGEGIETTINNLYNDENSAS